MYLAQELGELLIKNIQVLFTFNFHCVQPEPGWVDVYEVWLDPLISEFFVIGAQVSRVKDSGLTCMISKERFEELHRVHSASRIIYIFLNHSLQLRSQIILYQHDVSGRSLL